MSNNSIIDISTSTIIRVILIILGVVFLYLIRDIILIIFVAMIISAAFNGPIGWLQKYRVPRFMGVAFVYLLFLLLIALAIYLIIPPFEEQIRHLTSNLPEYLSRLNLYFQKWWTNFNLGNYFQNLIGDFSGKISQLAGSVFSKTISFFGGLFSLGIILVISVYLSIQEKGVKRFVISLIPDNSKDYISALIERIEKKIGGWLMGQLILMLIVGLLVYVGLTLLGVKYALVLALIAAVLEIIPYIGPIVSAIIAVFLTFLQSPLLGFSALILYIIIQQLENHLIVPQVMKRTVGLNPIIIIVAMLIGAKLVGILGIILSVPVAASIAEVFNKGKQNSDK